MRKIFFLSALLLAMASGVSAQSITDRMLKNQQNNQTSGVRHIIGLSVGPSFVTSKMYYAPHDYSSWRPGVELTADYNCVWSSGIGFGLTYAHNMTNYKHDIHTTQDYVGPSLVYRSQNDKKWQWKAQAGIGYGHVGGDADSQGGFAFQSAVGVEYRFSKHVGVGVDLNAINTYMKDDEYTSDNEQNGVARITLNTGIRIYL